MTLKTAPFWLILALILIGVKAQWTPSATKQKETSTGLVQRKAPAPEKMVQDTFLVSKDGKLYTCTGLRGEACYNPQFTGELVPFEGEIIISKQKGLLVATNGF